MQSGAGDRRAAGGACPVGHAAVPAHLRRRAGAAGPVPAGLRLAIVGAGWIGAELATAAAALGGQVTVVEAGPAPLAAAIGRRGGSADRPLVRRGRAWTCGSAWPCEAVSPAGSPWRAASGSPRTRSSPPSACGPPPAGSRAPASGWRTAWPSTPACAPRCPASTRWGTARRSSPARFGRRLRFEHWDVALHAPEVVAANVLGGSEVYDPVPYFWSEQFGRMVQYAATTATPSSLIWRGDPAARTWAACWLTGGRLVAMLDRGQPPRPGPRPPPHRLRPTPVDPARLTDPAVPSRPPPSPA